MIDCRGRKMIDCRDCENARNTNAGRYCARLQRMIRILNECVYDSPARQDEKPYDIRSQKAEEGT